jgi:predicted GH43/DUF377 family glycosyl hydrolase
MTAFPHDRLVITPHVIDLARSPLAGHFDAETYVLGAFNPGMTVLPNGNVLLMVRVAEALREPVRDGKVHAIRWDGDGREIGGQAFGRYVLDAWPLELVDTRDPRKFMVPGGGWKVMALTSLSWLLPVEMTPDAMDIVAIHYDKAIAPQGPWQCYGLEDARISRVAEGQYLMTTCSVSPERHSTTLYSSDNGLDWTFEGLVLDHQNKDMLIFEGLVNGQYWAQTRPGGLVVRLSPWQPLAGRPVHQPGDFARWTPLEAAPFAAHPPAHRQHRQRPHGRRRAADPHRSGRPARLAQPVARSGTQGNRRRLPHVLDASR